MSLSHRKDLGPPALRFGVGGVVIDRQKAGPAAAQAARSRG